jgi:hypothetical protein
VLRCAREWLGCRCVCSELAEDRSGRRNLDSGKENRDWPLKGAETARDQTDTGIQRGRTDWHTCSLSISALLPFLLCSRHRPWTDRRQEQHKPSRRSPLGQQTEAQGGDSAIGQGKVCAHTRTATAAILRAIQSLKPLLFNRHTVECAVRSDFCGAV